jgi:methylated-DNA-[protein]-cysteine S-methyltransferase
VGAATGFTLFDTAIGRCAIAWSDRGVTGVQLPEATDAETAGRIRRHLGRSASTRPAEPPGEVGRTIEGLRALVAGDRAGAAALAAAALDERGVPEFERRVYRHLRTVGAGETTTYGEIANWLGEPGAAQAVGRAMARNPWVLLVPCHRVLAGDGGLGGYSGPGGVEQKRRLLEIEGAAAVAQRGLFG